MAKGVKGKVPEIIIRFLRIELRFYTGFYTQVRELNLEGAVKSAAGEIFDEKEVH